MKAKDYAVLYGKLKAWAVSHGYIVRDHGSMLDYKGMNQEAKRELGLDRVEPDNQIDIEYDLSAELKFKTLSHEIIERRKMHYEGWPYKKAHPYAERNQGNLKITEDNPYPKRSQALRKLGVHKVIQIHDDGDLTVKKIGGGLHVVTTEGQVFKETAMTSNKFFHPQVHTGWEKDLPIGERRRKVIDVFKGDALASARSLQALANVTQDEETKRQARKDALYFYQENSARQKARETLHERVDNLKHSKDKGKFRSHAPHEKRKVRAPITKTVPPHHTRRGGGVTRRADR